MKKSLKFCALLATTFLLAGCSLYDNGTSNSMGNNTNGGQLVSIISADYPNYDSIESLTYRATDIVKVEIVDKNVEEINILIDHEYENEYLDPGSQLQEAYHIFTVYTVRVLDVYKGSAVVGDLIDVKQIGGETEKEIFINHDQITLNQGTEYILFLESFYGTNITSNLLNPIQSAYIYSDISTMSSYDSFRSVNNNNDSTLTLNDIIRISEEN